MENNWQFVITPAGSHRMDYSTGALIAVVNLSRPGGEYPVLQEEGLVSWDPLFNDMSLAGLLLLLGALLKEQRVELSFGLGSEVAVQEVISVDDVLL